MKLIVKKFEELAKRKKYKNGAALLKKAGGGTTAYHLARKGHKIGYEVTKNLYNLVGEIEIAKVIDWEGGTLNGFKSKFVQVGSKLF